MKNATISILLVLLLTPVLAHSDPVKQNFSSGATSSVPKKIKPATPQRQRPEVIIPNVTKKQILDIITNRMLDKDYQLASANDYLAVFKKKSESFMADILFGSKYDSTPEARVSYNLVEAPAGIRVIATLEIITNPGSGYEHSTNCDKSKSADGVQKMLEEIKESLAK